MDAAALNGHIETAEQCRDWLAAERALGGEPFDGGKVDDFTESIGVVLAELERMQELAVARARRNVARKAVTDWMDAEANNLRLVQAGQAPGWFEYEAAEAAWILALETFDAQLVEGGPR